MPNSENKPAHIQQLDFIVEYGIETIKYIKLPGFSDETDLEAREKAIKGTETSVTGMVHYLFATLTERQRKEVSDYSESLNKKPSS